MKKIVVLGSLNMDMVVAVDGFVHPGATIFANNIAYVNGGKGGNQGVASSRAGADVSMIAQIGGDDHGQALLAAMKQEGISTEHVSCHPSMKTGLAIINVDSSGENTIVLSAGANMGLEASHITGATECIASADILIAQLEIPISVVHEGLRVAKDNSTITILNPAPAATISADMLRCVDIIVPNETEASFLTGINVVDEASARHASKELLRQGVGVVVITLGSKGALVAIDSSTQMVKGHSVEVVDTTAAGDTFIGFFAEMLDISRLDDMDALIGAVDFANRAASITVQKTGAQPSIATIAEVKEGYGRG